MYIFQNTKTSKVVTLPSPPRCTHGIGAPLQQDVDGSVDVPVAVVQGDHGLVLVLACDVDQLAMAGETETA